MCGPVADANFEDAEDPGRKALSIQKLVREFQHCIGAPERCPFPVIAAAHGPVIGLGIDLLSYCDVRYASSDATFSIKVRAMFKYDQKRFLQYVRAGSRYWYGS
jgi:enoyl-CoA hydratase/carnithine racemase